MKKILALALFLGLTASAFAMPGCSHFVLEGTNTGLLNKYVENGSGIQNPKADIPPVEFTCTIEGIQPGEKYYYRAFAFYPFSWFNNHSENMTVKDFMAMGSPKNLNTDGMLEINFDTLLWAPETNPIIELTEADNGTTITQIWADGLANQSPYEGLAVYYSIGVISFCTDENDINSCQSVLGNSFIPGHPKIKTYELYNTITGDPVSGTLEAPTIPVSYAMTSKAEVDIYLIKEDCPIYINLMYEDLFGDIGAIIGDELVAWESKGIVEPAQTEVEYFEFTNIPSGEYRVWVRYIRKPEIDAMYALSTYGVPFMNSSWARFEYTNTTGVEELEIKQLVNSENRLAFECDGKGVCDIYDLGGRLIQSIPFDRTFEHNKTDKKGMYLYNIKSDGKQTTLKGRGR